MLWTEKYRPTTLSEIVGQEHFVLDAQTWVAEMNMPNVLISGDYCQYCISKRYSKEILQG